MRQRLILALLIGAALAGCQQSEPPAPAAESPPPVAPVAATPPTPPPTSDSYSFGPEISVEDFLQHVKVLASDEFEGRAPGTRGEELTTAYIEAQFKRLGLKPGNGDSYFQRVPMVETTARPADATISIGDKTQTLKFGDQYVVGTRTGNAEVKIENSDLVFVGYGVNAPEANWNDYAGLDVKGKTVVMLVNDPGFHAGNDALFGGKRMTYYGRWTYKFEEAARQGASAALIIHDTAGAGYGWDVVKNSWSGAQYDLPASSEPEKRIPLQGWITGETAQTLFDGAGLKLDDLRAAANKPGFKAVPLNAQFSSTILNQVRETASNNVLAVLPGTEKPDEAIIYMGHWDHLGKHEGEGDQIYNGAIDNATGVAGILEIAEQFTVQDPKPKRSVMFMAVTLEESGLLGSKYYVAHPTIPLDHTVAAINIDAMGVFGKTRDIVVNGFGASELEDILRPIADAQQRVLHAETGVEKGFYFRSDHFNFAKAGVPALYAESGMDSVDGGEAAGMKIADEYEKNRYHQPKDEVDPSWDLGGVVQDLGAFYLVGKELAGSDQWPNWRAGNEFKAARDAMMKAKGGK